MIRVFALALLVTHAAAQTTHHVGVGHPFQNVQDAIDAAAAGDTIIVHAMASLQNEGFSLNKGLTIRALGFQQFGTGHPDATATVTQISIPSGQHAHIENLHFDNGYSPVGQIGHLVIVDGDGGVTFVGCRFEFRNGAPLRLQNAGAVVLDECVAQQTADWSSGPGIESNGCDLTLRDSTVVGGHAGVHPFSGLPFAASPGLTSSQGSLHAERITVTGGNGSTGLVVTSGDAWISGSTLRTTGGLSLDTTGIGSGEAQLNNVALPDGSAGPVTTNAPMVRMKTIGPRFTRGMTTTLEVRAQPGVPAAVCLTFDATPTPVPGITVQPLWLMVGTCVLFGTTDASGSLSFPVTFANDPALEHQHVRLQAVAGTSLPVHVSTRAGGVIH